MISRIVFTANALDHGFQLPEELMDRLEDTLLDHLKSHSRILFGSGEEVQTFLKWIKESNQLSPAARSKWQTLLSELKKLRRVGLIDPNANLENALTQDDLKASVGQSADIVILGATKAKELLVGNGDFSPAEKPPVLTTLFKADQTPQFKHFLELEKIGVLPYGEFRENFWKDILHPLLLTSKNVYLLDKYLFGQVRNRIDQSWRERKEPREQILWLLDKIDSSGATDVHLHLIGASEKDKYSSRSSLTETIEYMRRYQNFETNGAIRELSIYELEDIRKFPHDRHIRFDSGFAVMINSGFDRLKRSKIEDEHGMGWQFISSEARLEELRKSEKGVLNHSSIRSEHFLRLEW